jgi:hypothetical protein
MPSRNRVAGGVEPLDFAAADEAVGELVKVVGGEDDDGFGGKPFEAVEPHDFGLRGHAVGFVHDDDFPAAAAAIGRRVMRRSRSSTARPSCMSAAAIVVVAVADHDAFAAGDLQETVFRGDEAGEGGGAVVVFQHVAVGADEFGGPLQLGAFARTC